MIELAPNFFGGHMWAAAGYYSLGRSEDGLAAMKTAAKLDPTNNTLGLLGCMLAMTGENEKAEADEDVALKKGLLDDAQRAYDRLKDGPNAQDIAAAEARVAAAKAALNQAIITAPFGGVITDASILPCDQVVPGEQFCTAYNNEKGYYDLFLIDTEGNVIYSVTHEADFGTNVVNGVYASSGLGHVAQAALDGEFVITDIESYAPSAGIPASFIGEPLTGANGEIGQGLGAS